MENKKDEGRNLKGTTEEEGQHLRGTGKNGTKKGEENGRKICKREKGGKALKGNK